MKKIIYLLTLVVMVVGGYFLYSYLLLEENPISDKFTQGSSRERELETYVYETPVDSAEECSVHEAYDVENGVCFFECANEVECAEIEKTIEEEFGQWTDELANEKSGMHEEVIPENDESLIAQYQVGSSEKITLETGKDSDKNKKIWAEVAELSPDALSDKYIEKFQIFDNKNDDTLAFVDDEDGNGKWRVAVNLAGYNTSTERENKSTIIHELAHIISLNTLQINPNSNKDSCRTFYLDEGCANGNSYLYNFQKAFWVGIPKNTEGGADYSQENFVTEYAATNEVEDLAESFAFFVLGKEGQPNTPTKNSKINFFYQYPELQQIRKDMRSVLTQEIVRARKLSN